MHFRTMLFVELPETQPDPQWEKQTLDKMEELKADHPGKAVESVLLGLCLSTLTNVQTTFGCALRPVVETAMERFYCGTQDPKYLLFEDRTDEYMEDFNKNIVCVSMPDGRICAADDYAFYKEFKIQDGKVFQKKDGGLKRTITARRMRVLLEYPRSKLYRSFEEYVEEVGGVKNEETGRYGEWYNPNSVYDWYSIGGRWPQMFLVKQECTEFSYGERKSMDEADYPAPEGYRWVAAARKKDIQWDAMRAWRNKQAEERFRKLEEMFQSGNVEDPMLKITEEGIFSWGDQLYRKGQSLEEFMAKYGIPDAWKYPISVCGIFIDECYHDEHDAVYDEEQKKTVPLDWQSTMDEHIDDADDNTVFVGIDYHM